MSEDTTKPERSAFPADGLCTNDRAELRWAERIYVSRDLRLGADGTWLVRGGDEDPSDGDDQHAFCPSCLREYELPESMDFDPDATLPIASHGAAAADPEAVGPLHQYMTAARALREVVVGTEAHRFTLRTWRTGLPGREDGLPLVVYELRSQCLPELVASGIETTGDRSFDEGADEVCRRMLRTVCHAHRNLLDEEAQFFQRIYGEDLQPYCREHDPWPWIEVIR